MKTVSAKLDGQTHRRLVDLCNERGCNVNEFLKERINEALESSIVLKEEPTPKGQLVDVESNSKREIVKGTVRWVSSEEARNIPKARAVHHLDSNGKLTRSDHYDENGRLKYSEEPPTNPGGKPRVIIYS